jgi:uncharacterized protein YdeI (YjbR/CyaY-like superfamily)
MMADEQMKKVETITSRSFRSAPAFRRWLAHNHAKADELWLRIFKKHSGETTVNYAEALEEALCFGWIDGQKKPCDEVSWLQRFCPRGPKSKWSKINTKRAEYLIEQKRMTRAGLQKIERAKEDGRWKAAYDSPSNTVLPAEFLRALKTNAAAYAFYQTLNSANVYAIAYRLQTAKKPETKQRWIQRVLLMLERGERFH